MITFSDVTKQVNTINDLILTDMSCGKWVLYSFIICLFHNFYPSTHYKKALYCACSKLNKIVMKKLIL